VALGTPVEREGGNAVSHSGTAPRVAPALVAVACALVILASAWLLRPYTYMTVNHALQVPLVQSERDPALYPTDPFVDTLDQYSSWYWLAVARFTLLPLKTTLGILYFLTVSGGLLAAALLGRALAPGSAIAPWASAIAFGLGVRPFVGDGTITTFYPEHTSIAVVFFILTFAAIAARRPWLAAVSYGIGFSLNQMYGIHAALYVAIFAVIALAMRRLDRRWLAAGLLSAVMIAPTVILSARAASAGEYGGPEFMAAWAGALHHVGERHFYLLSNERGGFIAMGAVLLAVIAVARADRDSWRRALAVSAAAAGAGWLAIAVLLTAIPPSTALLAHAVRGADLFVAIGLIYLVARLVAWYERDRAEGDGGLLPLAGLVGLLSIYHLIPPTLSALGLLGLGVSVSVRARLRNAGARQIVCAMAAIMLVVAVWEVALHQPGRGILFRMGASEEIRQAAAWADANTDIDATFMVSPVSATDEHAMFRPLSTRGLFVSYKDLAAILWKAAYLPTYLERMGALGMVADAGAGRLFPAEEMRARWEALTDEELSAVARRYGVDFVVFEAGRETKLPIVFRNRSYKIARFPTAQRGGPPPVPPDAH